MIDDAYDELLHAARIVVRYAQRVETISGSEVYAVALDEIENLREAVGRVEFANAVEGPIERVGV